MQAFTAAILVLAANTAFNGFPILASILGQDGFLPRQFARRGDRLVFSNGIVILAVLAAALIWAFDASTTRLIQLYIIGVFVSFTLSQAGMVRHWTELLQRDQPRQQARSMHRSLAINAIGAVFTALVLVIVLVTKFTHGAWIVVIAMPLVFVPDERHPTALRPGRASSCGPSRRGCCCPAASTSSSWSPRLHTPTLRALAFARATRPSTLSAVTVRTSAEETDQLISGLGRAGHPGPADRPGLARTATSPGPSWNTSPTCAAATPATSCRCSSPSTSSGTGGSTCCTTRAPCASRPGCCSSPG